MAAARKITAIDSKEALPNSVVHDAAPLLRLQRNELRLGGILGRREREAGFPKPGLTRHRISDTDCGRASSARLMMTSLRG